MRISGEEQISLTNQLHNPDNQYNYYADNNTFWMFKTSWSPSGKCLVFSNVSSGNLDLFTVSLPDGELKQITQSPEAELTPVWDDIN